MNARVALVLALTVAACAHPPAVAPDNVLAAAPALASAPAGNASSPAKRELGRLLFWDPVLSGARDVSCASCHDPAFAYADGRASPIGTGGAAIGRNAPSVLRAAWNGLRAETRTAPEDAPMFWDNRARSLEDQARGPLHAPREMRGRLLDDAEVARELPRRLRAIPAYEARFEQAFGSSGITEDRIVMAIATFERGLARSSAFDRYMRGDAGALATAQKRGLAGFVGAGCTSCHGGPMLSDFALHSVYPSRGHRGVEDRGDGRGRFRTPSLRNVARTAPYMHDGALATLDAVYDYYDVVAKDRDPGLAQLGSLDRGTRADITAFLGALSDDAFDAIIPDAVPSGLPVGGARCASSGATAPR